MLLFQHLIQLEVVGLLLELHFSGDLVDLKQAFREVLVVEEVVEVGVFLYLVDFLVLLEFLLLLGLFLCNQRLVLFVIELPGEFFD